MEKISEVKKIRRVSYTLLFNALGILLLSLISVYSATSHRTMGFFYREIIFTFVGIVAYIVFSVIDYRYYSKYSKLIYVLNILILLAVFIFGTKRLGAQRWIDLGFIVVQPSEFSKIMIILTFSDYLVGKYSKNRNDGFKKMFFSFFHIVPIFLLIAKQPDLGTSLSLIFIYMVILFINGLNWRVIVSLGAGVATFIPLAYNFLLKPYQRQRVITFLDPEADLLGSGWNVTQSKIAIGSGGIYGKGLLNSTQSKLRFLPEAHTDFIGSVYLEETGLVGGALLLFIYILLIFQIMYIGDKAKDEFGRLVCYGIAGIFLFHVIVNLGMVMGIMPVTGKPLLIMSYGGSSLILSFIMLGIVQSVRVHREL